MPLFRIAVFRIALFCSHVMLLCTRTRTYTRSGLLRWWATDPNDGWRLAFQPWRFVPNDGVDEAQLTAEELAGLHEAPRGRWTKSRGRWHFRPNRAILREGWLTPMERHCLWRRQGRS